MTFKIFILLLVLILFSPSRFGSEFALKNFMVVWNVGQGQWATLKDQEGCHHFDMGGEKNPIKHVRKLCGDIANFIYLSHWDWDHISFVRKSASVLAKRCLAMGPLGTSSPRKMKDLATVEKCLAKDPLVTKVLTNFSLYAPKDSNDSSHVLLVAERFLLPGDSSRTQELRWSKSQALQKARWLLLGHHGSRTSTSAELLNRMPQLQVAVASARSRRYGHPHIEVKSQLKHHHIPLLRTEDWGHLWFEL